MPLVEVGGLIQTAAGSSSGCGGPLTNRSGWAPYARASTILVLDYVFREGPAPAGPFPESGTDTTEDDGSTASKVCPDRTSNPEALTR